MNTLLKPGILIAVAVLAIAGGTAWGLTHPDSLNRVGLVIDPAANTATTTLPVALASSTTDSVSTATTTAVVAGEPPVSVKVFSAPRKGDTFVPGDAIGIKWNPAYIDVSEIKLVCADKKICSFTQVIYQREDSDRSIAKLGEFVYQYSEKFYTLDPGLYYVEINSPGKWVDFKSDTFTLLAHAETAPRTTALPYIKSIDYLQSTYSPGDSILFSIDARDSDGKVASSDLGFNIQAHIFDTHNYPGPSFDAGNLDYDPVNKLWHGHLHAPADTSIQYELQVSLYCGYVGLNSICAQEHGTSNSQVDKFYAFKVK